MAVPQHKCRPLGALPPGTKVRLHAKYRDGEPRPRYKFGDVYLQQGNLTVLRHQGDAVVCQAGKHEVALWRGLQIATG